jgi:hypothetical protein
MPESSRLVVTDEAIGVRIADPVESATDLGSEGG